MRPYLKNKEGGAGGRGRRKEDEKERGGEEEKGELSLSITHWAMKQHWAAATSQLGGKILGFQGKNANLNSNTEPRYCP